MLETHRALPETSKVELATRGKLNGFAAPNVDSFTKFERHHPIPNHCRACYAHLPTLGLLYSFLK